MEPTEPITQQPKQEKSTPSQEIPAFSAREAARIWGVSSDNRVSVRKRYPYSVT